MLRLKELRGKRTQEYTAKQLGLTQRSYQNYECGARQADYDTLIKMAQYFGVSIEYLLGVDEKDTATVDDYVAGFTDTRSFELSGIEKIWLDLFREIGADGGREAQERAIELVKIAFYKGE